MKKSIFIQDLSFDFDRNPLTGRLNVVKNEFAIKQSIKTLVLLNAFEKPYSPTIYTGISSYLFEQMNAVTIGKIKENIEKIINLYEPRVILEDVQFLFPSDDNFLNINIIYRIIGQEEEKDSVSLILGRAR